MVLSTKGTRDLEHRTQEKSKWAAESPHETGGVVGQRRSTYQVENIRAPVSTSFIHSCCLLTCSLSVLIAMMMSGSVIEFW